MTLENPAASPKLQDNLTGKWFDQIFLLVLENHGWTQTAAMKMVDYIFQFGVVFTDWHGTTHPSGPNYRSMFSGQSWSTNEFDGVKRPNIGDSVPVYQYNYAGPPADRHNPFYDMKSIEARLHLTFDMSNITAKGLHYLGMDDQNDAHSASLDIADTNVMNAIKFWNSLDHPSYRNDIFFVVFDEAFGLEYINNHVFAGMLFGSALLEKTLKGRIVSETINHYNFAQMLYDNWNVPMNPSADPSANTYAGHSLWEVTNDPNNKSNNNSLWDKFWRWI